MDVYFKDTDTPEGTTGTAQVTTVTRFWAKTVSEVHCLKDFLRRASSYSNRIIVAINIDADEAGTVHLLCLWALPAKVIVIKVSPWGGVTHTLNLLLHEALGHNPDLQSILFQSPEVHATAAAVETLQKALCHRFGDTLVAGYALEGHTVRARSEGWYALEAATVPWNTLALWNAKMLSVTGFPAVADMVSPPGMEEAAVIALQQKLFGMERRIAILLAGPSLVWNTNFSGQRLEQHIQKMHSKSIRVNAILHKLLAQEDTEQSRVLVCKDVAGFFHRTNMPSKEDCSCKAVAARGIVTRL